MNDASQTSGRIVIIGGGIAGLSIAVRLAQSGMPITLLEASQLGHAGSTRNQGWLHSGGLFAREHAELARMCHRSRKQTLEFCPECLEPDHQGMAYVFSRPETSISDWKQAWEHAEIPHQELSRSDVSAALPGFAESEVQQAFLLPDRSIIPHVLLARMAETAERAGAEIRTETTVVDFALSGDRVQGVRTSTGEEIAARLVILAGGAEGMALRAQVVHEDAGRQTGSQAVPMKTHLVAVEPGAGPLPFCVLDAGGFNHLPHGTKSIFGSERWLVISNPTDRHVLTAETDAIWGHISRFLPQLDREKQDVLEWAGVTIQAMHLVQIEPGHAPLPTVIDHRDETPRLENMLTVFPGRATLWPQLAEKTRTAVLERLNHTPKTTAHPPWQL